MLKLDTIIRCSSISKAIFEQEYAKPLRPLILTNFTQDWAARQKWTFDFFAQQYGNLEVPLYSPSVANPGKKYLQPERYMPLANYIRLLQGDNCDWRMFLFNIFDYAPSLCADFKQPTIISGFLKRFPFMFFGGQNAKVGLHYDIDMSHVFLSQFEGRKRITLFAPQQSYLLYQHPFTVASFIDPQAPDYEKYPALRYAQGYSCILQPHETLFIPSGYWHSVEYLDSGFSMSLRANASWRQRTHGFYNIARHYTVDCSMNHLFGQRWRNFKTRLAHKRADMALIQHGL